MLVWPIVFASIAFYLLDAKEAPRLLFAAALGTAVMMMWAQVVVGAGGALDNQRVFGTLELLVAAPVPLVSTIAPIMIASGAFGVSASSSRSSGDGSCSASRSRSMAPVSRLQSPCRHA